jgi:hypothetical protein
MPLHRRFLSHPFTSFRASLALRRRDYTAIYPGAVAIPWRSPRERKCGFTGINEKDKPTLRRCRRASAVPACRQAGSPCETEEQGHCQIPLIVVNFIYYDQNFLCFCLDTIFRTGTCAVWWLPAICKMETNQYGYSQDHFHGRGQCPGPKNCGYTSPYGSF